MIVFVPLSARRFMVLDVSYPATGWTRHDEDGGFTHASPPTVILRGGSYEQASRAAAEWCKENGRMVTHAAWKAKEARALK